MSSAPGKRAPVTTAVVLFAAGAAAILAVVLVLILSSVASYRARTQFAQAISRIDDSMRVADYRSAAILLDEALDIVADSHAALRLYKREVQVRNAAPALAGPTRIHQLQTRYPDSHELLALRVAALLQERRFGEAWELSQGLPLPDWAGLRAEAAFRAGKALDPTPEGQAGISIVLKPADYGSVPALTRAWDASGDRRYLMNAASILALTANLQAALDVLGSGRAPGVVVSQREALMEFLLVYDLRGAGAAFAAARGDELGESAAGTRLLADLLLMSGDAAGALLQLEFLRGKEAATEQDVLNEAWLLGHLGRTGPRAEVLEYGLESFPESSSMKLAYYSVLLELTDRENAARLLRRWADEHPDDELLQTAWVVRDLSAKSLSEVYPALWSLENRFSESDTVRRLIAWSAWRLGNYSDLELILAKTDASTDVWTNLYRGLEALRLGDVGTSIRLGSRISPNTANLAYLAAGLRAALVQPGDPAGALLLRRTFERAAENRMLSGQMREYYLYLAAWRALLFGEAEGATRWYSELHEEFPQSIHLSQLRFWLQEFRRIHGFN